MPVFVVRDAHGETATMEITHDTLEFCGGVLEALAADDAPSEIALTDVGLECVSAALFALVLRAAYGALPSERLLAMGDLISSPEWVVAESALQWLRAPESLRYIDALRVEGSTLDEFAVRLRVVLDRGSGFMSGDLVSMFRRLPGLALGLCERRGLTVLPEGLVHLFDASCGAGDLEAAKRSWSLHRSRVLGAGGALDPGFDLGRSFRFAAESGFLEVLEFLWGLHTDERVPIDLAALGCPSFRDAARNGHMHVLEYLWHLRKTFRAPIDPAANDNAAFRFAAANGHLRVLQWLCRLHLEERVPINVTTRNNEAFRMAAMGGHVDVVEFLWHLGRSERLPVDPAVDGGVAFESAVRYSHIPVVRFLVGLHTEGKVLVAPPAVFTNAVLTAATNGCRDLVELFWNQRMVLGLPLRTFSVALARAFAKRLYDVVEFLERAGVYPAEDE